LVAPDVVGATVVVATGNETVKVADVEVTDALEEPNVFVTSTV
jgi:hypothetical protein